MNNLLPRSVRMHQKYDLKGSTYKRRASQKEREKVFPTYKDLDFLQDIPDGLFLDADMYSALCKTLQRDCLVGGAAARGSPRVPNELASFKGIAGEEGRDGGSGLLLLPPPTSEAGRGPFLLYFEAGGFSKQSGL